MLQKHLTVSILALLAALIMSFSPVALAENTAVGTDESDYSLLSTLDNENMDEVLRLLFAAAAGTDTETERAARKKMSASQQKARNAQNAAYRERVLPWLRECFADLLKEGNGTTQTGTPQTGTPQTGTPQSGTPQSGTAQAGDEGSTGTSAPKTNPTRTTIKIKVNNSTIEKSDATQKTDNMPPILRTSFLPDDADDDTSSAPASPFKSTTDTGYDSGSGNADIQKKAQLESAFAAFGETDTGKAYLDKMRSLGAKDAADALALTRTFCSAWLDKIHAEVMAAANPDYECWIYCPDTLIDYPVMHGTDNSYYMSHLPNGADNRYGSLFIDFRNLRKLQDPNTLIYGHHMKNGAMFKALSWYSEQAFYEAHPYMLLITPDMVYILQVFAGRVVNESDRSADIALGDPQALLDYAKAAKEQSKFNASVTVEPTDRLVTLSTCAYDTWDSRYLLTGRLLPCGSESITVVFSPYAEALDDSGGAWG